MPVLGTALVRSTPGRDLRLLPHHAEADRLARHIAYVILGDHPQEVAAGTRQVQLGALPHRARLLAATADARRPPHEAGGVGAGNLDLQRLPGLVLARLR